MPPTHTAPCPYCPQRLQRFSTYGHLKQMVLKMIVDEIQTDVASSGDSTMGEVNRNTG